MKKWLVILVVSLFALSIVSGCGSSTPAKPAQEQAKPIKIGVVTSLTGERALTGQYSKNGIMMAIEEVNAKGGINGRKLEAFFEDDNGNEPGAVNAFNKVVSSGADLIIGPIYSNMDMAISPSIKKAEIPTLVIGSSNDLAKQQNPWMFQSRTADAISAAALANYASKNLKLKKVALLHDTDNFATGAATVAEKTLVDNGTPAVLREAYNSGDKDFTPQLAKIKASGADGILAWSQMVEAGLIMKQMKALDINIPLIGSNSYITKIATDLAKANAEGVYSVADYVHTSPAPKTVEFAKKYKEKYKIESEFNAAMNYDAVSLAIEAFTKAGSTDKNKVREALAGIKDYVGVATTYTFDKNNVGGTGVTIVQLKNNVLTVIESVKGK
jgi:branched-chain amino acid transport system substrate-binding protein